MMNFSGIFRVINQLFQLGYLDEVRHAKKHDEECRYGDESKHNTAKLSNKTH